MDLMTYFAIICALDIVRNNQLKTQFFLKLF